MYIISGRHHAEGILNNDSSNLMQGYWELGWECTISNVYIKQGLSEGKFSKSDTVVTRKDREFMYSSVFDEVIDWDTFVNERGGETNNECFAIPDIIKMSEIIKFDYDNVDVDLLCDMDLDTNIEKKYNITDKFMVYCVRLRKHSSYRNMNINVAKNAMRTFIDKGYRVFIVGYGSEYLEEELPVTWVNLRDYASLLASKHCKFTISGMSGIIHLANFVGRENLTSLIFDQVNYRGKEVGKNHPLFMGDNVNYKKLDRRFVPTWETEAAIYSNLKDFL